MINVSMKKVKVPFKLNKVHIRALIIVFALIVIGVAILSQSRAAIPVASFEVEDGTKSTNALKVPIASASNGNALKFSIPATGEPKCATLTNLQFWDDFDGPVNTAPDSTKWNVFTSGSSWGGQCWTNKPENIAIDGQGNLRQTLIYKGTTAVTILMANQQPLQVVAWIHKVRNTSSLVNTK